MNDRINGKIRWSAIFGFCFLLSVVIQQTILRVFAKITPSNTGDFYLIFTLWSLAFFPFFATLILNVRGYMYLSEKYGRGVLRLGAWIFSVAATMMYTLLLLHTFQTGTHVDTQLANLLIGLVILPYVAGLIIMGLGTFTLKNRLGNVVLWPTGLGVLLLLEAVFVFFQYLAGASEPSFVGWYVWVPVYESLFVISSIALFFRASRD